LDHPEYPKALLEVSDPPALLYCVGRLDLLHRPALAIVGSRNATAQGARNAQAFARALSDAGLTIVSGLALGVDAAAHLGGLEGPSSTIAVLGTGIDVVYPPRNKDLAQQIAASGLLVSEFALGSPAAKQNFLGATASSAGSRWDAGRRSGPLIGIVDYRTLSARAGP
jgi:DNA processing protein